MNMRNMAGKGVKKNVLFTIIGILVGANIILIYCYRRNLQEELKTDMKEQVNSAVS